MFPGNRPPPPRKQRLTSPLIAGQRLKHVLGLPGIVGTVVGLFLLFNWLPELKLTQANFPTAVSNVTAESIPIDADSNPITLKTTPYRLAAGMLVIQAVPQMMWHGATWSWTAIALLSFRLIVVLGLAGSRGWARTLALGFAVFGAILAPAMYLDAPPLQAVLRTVGTWAFCGALIILLYGPSTTRRIWLAAGVFAIGFCIDLWLSLASWSKI